MQTIHAAAALLAPLQCAAALEHIRTRIVDLARHHDVQLVRMQRVAMAMNGKPDEKDFVPEFSHINGLLAGAKRLLFTMAPEPTADGEPRPARGAEAAESLRDFTTLYQASQMSVHQAYGLLADAAARLDRLETSHR